MKPAAFAFQAHDEFTGRRIQEASPDGWVSLVELVQCAVGYLPSLTPLNILLAFGVVMPNRQKGTPRFTFVMPREGSVAVTLAECFLDVSFGHLKANFEDDGARIFVPVRWAQTVLELLKEGVCAVMADPEDSTHFCACFSDGCQQICELPDGIWQFAGEREFPDEAVA